jgi:hypothetical protein
VSTDAPLKGVMPLGKGDGLSHLVTLVFHRTFMVHGQDHHWDGPML